MLGVSRASAGEMLKRLEADGLIERGTRKEALLTPNGRVRAEHVVRQHRLIERLLTDFIGYTAAEAHVHADELGDTFSDEMVERIAGAARQSRPLPARLARGYRSFEQEENKELSAAVGAGAGARAPPSSAWRSTTASSCTGSTTRATCRARRSGSLTSSVPPARAPRRRQPGSSCARLEGRPQL